VSARRVVLCTVAGAEDADRIAGRLVEQRLAACVNVVSAVSSVYRWRGRIERDREHLLVIKTTADRFEELREEIVRLHPYDVPEVVALTIEAGHQPYLDWLDASCSDAEPEPA
jgi:periplasmic divalent cation tolerance protein